MGSIFSKRNLIIAATAVVAVMIYNRVVAPRTGLPAA